MVTVPKLEEASVFDLVVCFIKFQSAGVPEKLVSSSSEYRVLGHLADVEKKTGHPQTNIYMISEVIYSKKVVVKVEVGSAMKSAENRDVPVTFSYLTFPLDKHGILHKGLNKKVNKSAKFVMIDEKSQKL